jgi:hypothetical protein
VRRFLLAIFALTVASALLPAQPPVSEKIDWIAKNAVALRSIDPRDDDFADLAPLKQSIGSAHFVLLGGQSDIDTIFTKYRLVRFLNQEMGFNVVAFGLPFFDAEEIDRALDGKTAAIRYDLAQETDSVFSYGNATVTPGERIVAGNTIQGNARYAGAPIELPGTSQSHTFDILRYARATRDTNHPLHMAGYGQTVVGSPFSDYAKQLFEFIDRIDPALAPPADRAAIRKMVAWESLTSSRKWEKTTPRGLAAIDRLSEKLARLPENGPNAHELSLYRLTLAYLASWAGPKAGRTNVPQPTHPLYWYAKDWRPDSKIVVWSDNVRIVRNLPPAHDTGWRPPAPIGVDAIAQALGVTDYSIAFTRILDAADTLNVLVAGPQPSLFPFSGSFESLMQAAHLPYSFIDFRNLPQDHWLRRPLNARFFLGGDSVEISSWPANYDGAITIDLSALKSGRPAGLPK